MILLEARFSETVCQDIFAYFPVAFLDREELRGQKSQGTSQSFRITGEASISFGASATNSPGRWNPGWWKELSGGGGLAEYMCGLIGVENWVCGEANVEGYCSCCTYPMDWWPGCSTAGASLFFLRRIRQSVKPAATRAPNTRLPIAIPAASHPFIPCPLNCALIAVVEDIMVETTVWVAAASISLVPMKAWWTVAASGTWLEYVRCTVAAGQPQPWSSGQKTDGSERLLGLLTHWK